MKPYTARLITGIVIIIIGALLFLSNAGIGSVQDIVKTWWPMLGVLAGVVMIISNPKNYLWALFTALVGVIFQLYQLNILTVNPWNFVAPIIIMLVGLSILFNFSTAKKHRVSRQDRDDMFAILAGTEQHNTSRNYKGSKVYAVMGGAQLDLRKAEFAKEATVEIVGFWGGVELIVPKNIIVKNETLCILGGVEDKTDQAVGKNSPVLYVIGDVVMAGVEIKN